MALVCLWCAESGNIIGPSVFEGGFIVRSTVSIFNNHALKKDNLGLMSLLICKYCSDNIKMDAERGTKTEQSKERHNEAKGWDSCQSTCAHG